MVLKKTTSNIKCLSFFGLFMILFNISEAQIFYLVGIYNQNRPMDSQYDTIHPEYKLGTVYKMDSQNVEKLKVYCRHSDFINFYLQHYFINPDSIASVPLYRATETRIYKAILDKYDHKDYSIPFDSFPYFTKIDSNELGNIDYVVMIFKAQYSEGIFFSDSNCFDYNDDRNGMRRRAKIQIPCPEFYLNLAELNIKLINKIYIK